MAIESQGDLFDALARAEYDALIGTPESGWLEVKEQPYRLDEASQRWELVKDVAALAQSQGGVLVLGYSTEKVASEGADRARQHRPVPKALVSPEQYRAIIEERVYPSVSGIRTRWYPPDVDQEKGVFVIEVPPQRDTDKPFAVAKMVDGEGEHAHFVGFPRRDGDTVKWLAAPTIQHRLASFEAQTTLGMLSAESAPSDEDAAREIEMAVEAADADQKPWLVYQARPARRPSAGDDSFSLIRLRDVVGSHEWLRPNGFNFNTSASPTWVEGPALELDARATLRIADGGLVTAYLPADRDCLGWALSQYLPEGAPLRINPLTLVENTLEFFRVVDETIGRGSSDLAWRIKVVAHDMRRHSVLLFPGAYKSSGFPATAPSTERIARMDAWETEFDSTGDPERDAYTALAWTYALFDLEPSAIPYTSDQRVDSSQIREL